MKKNFMEKAGTMVNSVAKVAAVANVNSACFAWMHQEKIPESAKKLRKF